MAHALNKVENIFNYCVETFFFYDDERSHSCSSFQSALNSDQCFFLKKIVCHMRILNN